MTLLLLWRTILLLLAVLLTGCSGYDRALLVTKTNVGLDVDSTPPTSEITIARRELAIQPTFPEYGSKESALPLLGTFGLGGSYFNPNITGHFAGGDAAVYLTKKLPTEFDPAEPTAETDPNDSTAKVQEDEEPVDSALCLRNKPDTRSPLLKFWHFITFHNYKAEAEKGYEDKSGQSTRPFYFATDTAYGVKVAWNGTGGAYPDSLKLGYNRKEYASAPIFVDGKGSCPIGKEGPQEGHKVKMPSFYAAIDNGSGFTTFRDSGIDHVQFFATGKAANQFAAKPHVRAIAFSQMAPKAAKLKASRLGLNQELIKEVVDELNKGNTIKKTAIKMKATDLKLVEKEDISDSELVEKLNEYSNSPDPEVSNRLNKLRRVAVASLE